MKQNNLDKQFNILRQVEQKLKKNVPVDNTSISIRLQTNHIKYQNSIKNQSQQISMQLNTHFDSINNKSGLDRNFVTENQLQYFQDQTIQITTLKKQYKQLEKYTKFLQQMNQTLKQQLLYFTQKNSFQTTLQQQQRMTQIQYLKKFNQINQSKLQNQRQESLKKQIYLNSMDVSYHISDTLKPTTNKFNKGFKLFKNNIMNNSNIKQTAKKNEKKSITNIKSINGKENYSQILISNKKKHKMSIS